MMKASTSQRTQYLLWYGLGTVFLLGFLAPVHWRAFFGTPLPQRPGLQLVVEAALIMLCPMAAWLGFAGEGLSRRRKFDAWYTVLVATAICEVLHYWIVDRGHYFPESMFANNTTWQVYMHGPILDLSPGALPHSYRFAPDAIVQLFTWLCGDFTVSRIVYRLIFNALLFTAIFRYARTYVSDLFAGIAVLLIVALYPITILKYGGQFVDPMSHLAVVACLLCLARNYEPAFGPILFLGLFAKESAVLVVAVRFFYGPNRWRAAGFSAAYGMVSLAILLGIRHAVLHHEVTYGSISGVDFKHIPENLGWAHEWILMYVAIGAALIPGSVLGWKHMDRPFQWTTIIVGAATLISSLVFSWLSEIRNMLPFFVMLAVITVVYLERRHAAGAASRAAPLSSAPAARRVSLSGSLDS